ncbi:MAG: AraC family transcriptional regulator [Pseudonocardiaceae bacterium]|nr:AraC family transcriptional regulator [Pseudonocardiaceae bacterium]
MRTVVPLTAGDGFALQDVRIRTATRLWSAPEPATGYRLVFVARGLFRLRLEGWTGLVDPSVAYLGRPGDEQSIAHRPGFEDRCLVLTLDQALAEDLLHGQPAGPRCTSARADLARRELVARARLGADRFELAERVVWLAAELCGQAPAHAEAPASRRLADDARELLVDDPVGCGLARLAGTLEVSRSYLSRVFHAATGQTLTAFRRRLRVAIALDRLEAGEPDLARLAAELGFADHAHLTRTVRAEVGRTPSEVRTDLQALTGVPAGC